MADQRPFKSETIYDFVDVLFGGMNSGMVPLIIEKTQASFLGNVTVRDALATPRPPYSKNLQMVWPSDEVQTVVQTAVEQGLFQGCMQVPYQPDSGAPSQVAQISGRLFQFQIVADVVTVTEITIPNDPNPASGTQAWIWQSENFVVINDGLNLPIFWDGATSRRSYGPSRVLGTLAANTPAVPLPGEDFDVTLVAPFPGPFNAPVILDGFYFQPIEAGGYLVDAVSLYDIPTTAIPIDAQIIAKPSIAAVISTTQNYTAGTPFYRDVTGLSLPLTAPYTGAADSSVSVILFGKLWRIYGIANGGLNLLVIPLADGTFGASLPAGYQIQLSSSSSPNVIIGTVVSAATAPAIGGTVQIRINNVYSGAAGQIVYIGGVGQYKITAVPPAPVGTATLTLVNIDHPSGAPITIVTQKDIISVPELPAGRMGAYGSGQNWISLVDGTSFLPSDEVGGPSGTPAYNYRDSVLKTTLISFRAGNFRIPSSGDTITSMSFPAILDASLGQGALQIGTARTMHGCIAPINATVLASLNGSSPILSTSLQGRGPLSQNATINVNSDTLFRSSAGLGSFIIGRREFTQSISGNTPISEEMVRVLKKDNQQLLPYGSAVNFDNRVLYTCSPQASSQGVFHAGLVALNLDGISSMKDKSPPVYDGLWTGINVLQLSQGFFNGVSRAFAFTFNVALSKIELYELLPTGDLHFDNGVTPITSVIEFASLFNKDVKPNDVFIQLLNGEMAVDEVVGTVRFQIFYKPDQFGAYGEESCWIPWCDFTICAAAGSKPLYYPRLGFGEPDSRSCIPQLDCPARLGRTFQVKIIATGQYRFLSMRLAAMTQPMPQFQPPICNVGVVT